MYHGLVESFETPRNYAVPETGVAVQYWGRRLVVFATGVEIHGGRGHVATVLQEMGVELCKGSPHAVDAKSLKASADDTRALIPPSEASGLRGTRPPRPGCVMRCRR